MNAIALNAISPSESHIHVTPLGKVSGFLQIVSWLASDRSIVLRGGLSDLLYEGTEKVQKWRLAIALESRALRPGLLPLPVNLHISLPFTKQKMKKFAHCVKVR